jgi:osmotically-inducible protein OsmY
MSKALTKYRPLLRPLSQALMCAALLSTLSGCVGLMVGGAVAGAVATADRRTLGAQTDDKAIAVKAEVRLGPITGKYGHVNANSFNRQVLLTGEVQDATMKAAVEREVRAIDGVIAVANELEIAGPASYTSRSNDALITTKVKASLIDMKTISATSFKVITERGTVYLMGRVTQREGQVGADVARGVSGVTKVVKVLEYISEDEMRALSPNAKVEL